MSLSDRMTKIEDFIGRNGSVLCAIVAFCVPIKLVWTYLALLPFLLAWLIVGAPGLRDTLTRVSPVLKPLGFLYIIFIVSSIAGVSFLNSVRPLASLFLLVLVISLFATYARFASVALALVCGQSLASLHSVIDSAFPESIPSLFLGKVTESGQISFSLCLACALAFVYARFGSFTNWTATPPAPRKFLSRDTLMRMGSGGAFFIVVFFLGFSDSYAFASSTRFFLLALAVTLLVVQNLPYLLSRSRSWGPFVITTAIPLISCALLVNLKRGPWLGLFVSSIVAMIVLAPRLVPLALAGLTLLAVSVTPIRDRLEESYSHFTITGGRQVIWEIGTELSLRYPLGIGFQNSPVLRQYSSEIPPELRHFHNNFLNVLVEGGPLGLGAFFWLVAAMISRTFSSGKALRRAPDSILAFGCCLGIIAWQTAGLVEYNFGDTEVVLVFVVLTGAFFSTRKEKKSEIDSIGNTTALQNGALGKSIDVQLMSQS